MSAKPDNGGNNRISTTRRICVYSLLTALCLVLGFLEGLIPTGIGIKLGLSNAVALMLVCEGELKGAFSVNIARITLSALLFGTAVSFVFSFTAGMVSLAVTALLKRIEVFDTVGVSVVGAVVHNLVQLAVAMLITGIGAAAYLPMLLLGGIVSGAAVGVLSSLVLKKIKTKGKK